MTNVPIRLLENDSNRRGDLFGRLMADLFIALGYEQPRLNIHKSGRELDLVAEHRLETRWAIGECKATRAPIGGDEINKFVGALDAERKAKPAATGYFISLSGFKETAIEQEKQGRRTRIVMLDGTNVVEQLVQGRIIIPMQRATELAGRCCVASPELALDWDAELLAHKRGWIWCVYYTSGRVRTSFVLIHADGTPLARVLADEVVEADRNCNGKLHLLECMNPEPVLQFGSDAQLRQALEAYRYYLEAECGYIQLDGLPADSDVGSRRLRLENLFVPLHLDISAGGTKDGDKYKRIPVGKAIAQYPRLALLAAPGGGKSTLIKRLAVAYAEPTRRVELGDDLPDQNWFPLFFRCRELRSLARGSFAELLAALSEREPVRQYAQAFRVHVDQMLLAGRVLLLVDGLDEIAEPGDRAAFVCTLRTALQAYPGVALVMTSREAGFRHVAAHIAPVCTQATLSPFDASDIARLSVAWHREVVGDTEKVRIDAEELAATIWKNDRILRLAINPLLLTTLLLVKRWVGSLPTRRAVLYGKAVEVLLMTWNTEGHDPIPEEEALPQLCYVASAMMITGDQKISRPRLAACLEQAREALPSELGYVKGTVDDFIHRVEDRSSLLMMTGYDVEEGKIVEFYEFRHLTFQEYLTARGLVAGWHPGRQESDTLVTVLRPYFDVEEWREVIPLAAVLAGKETESLIRALTEEISTYEQRSLHEYSDSLVSLGNCLADEVAARPETIRGAIRQLIRFGSHLTTAPFVRTLVRGRYGFDFREEARKAFLGATLNLHNTSEALLQCVWHQDIEIEDAMDYAAKAEFLLAALNTKQALSQCEAALASVELFFRVRRDVAPSQTGYPAIFSALADELLLLLYSDEPAMGYATCSAVVWAAASRLWHPRELDPVLTRLYQLWRDSEDAGFRKMAALAVASLPLSSQTPVLYTCVSTAEFERVISQYEELDSWAEKPAALILAWYLGALPPREIFDRIRVLLHDNRTYVDERNAGQTLRELEGRILAAES